MRSTLCKVHINQCRWCIIHHTLDGSHVIRPVVEIMVSDNDDYTFLILVTLERDDIASRRLEYTHSDPRWCNNIVVFDGSLFSTTHSQTYVLSLCRR
jgi:hypothetical protein